MIKIEKINIRRVTVFKYGVSRLIKLLGTTMKKVVLFIISILVSAICFADPRQDIETFSKSLIGIIKDTKVDEFKNINCVQIPCGDIGLEFIFGEKDSSAKFHEIMSQKDITFKIFGPYSVESEYPESTYSVVFYSPSHSPFNAEGRISMDVGYAELYESFLQTQVTVIDGKVLFQRVPFYLESHHPYVGDYG
jgi:hypothetical protein